MSRNGRADEGSVEGTGTDASERVDEEAASTRPDRVARLRAENRRLRDAYDRALRSTHRRTALGLFLVGVVGLAAGALLPPVREVLVVLGATGVFAGLLTYYLTPERFVPADVGERVARDLVRDRGTLTAELGLSETRAYLPTGTGRPATLYVPQHERYELPAGAELESVFVLGEDDRARGVAFTPAGASLFEEIRESLADDLGETPGRLAEQVTEALVEGFELATHAEHEVDAASGRVSVEIHEGVFGSEPGFDDPLASLVAVAFAVGLDRPVVTTVRSGEGDVYTVTCQWRVEDEADAQGDAELEDGVETENEADVENETDVESQSNAADEDASRAGETVETGTGTDEG